MFVAMKISYNGSMFFGFQSQSQKHTISNTLKKAFESVGIFSPFVGSGRTDKGVHATAQVISLDIPAFHSCLEELKNLLNTKLYPHIKIKQIWEVSKNFNARFSAKRRGYCYVLSKHYSPFYSVFSYHHKIKNEALLQEAMAYLVGRHNFQAFSKKGGAGSKYCWREIYRVKLIQSRDFYILSFLGNSFLRSQIRLMVGFLLEIDKGKLTLGDLKRQLEGEEIFKIPAHPGGLFLSSVVY
ncbi:tRNA pseudouridine(38-40) synthase TruA [Helicobacter apodemus]|uniref:tRNA pseudouridine synthase A n=1 Tax=Helicobacter apodemus TaxID=135569 RepID=A0A2U8FC23_9HELI|nr:tRNA pseudouridine(38-40) synthase TruA [Helicobacter apodemus]AWI33437.1 tRNA pseudouridine(38-40) synthase TruA [Helicobacter apodemus]